ncbi:MULTISPECIES: LacI family DNA-binding transcriptional regulator [Microbacterium]|uniref:LacI family DNA-binding transcriptional regulator n=1 Tax=Microbacterium hominis TaxID=162426 RepID=A0A134DF14_9MICO|nr:MULTISPECIES: LacI family DNA-binding transcriptional regulator [Microbacterium]AUG30763.1 LacI family DNA-binding transcriptional regulator [Microbacterium hominis]KXC05111.1 LacI family transcriptional regulator [Microbacterium hominis]QOC26523.1 LacI family DNA-binding transcriptional regulator [Microbacterium hominis]QOC27696.1 LacI family DNA-binding transcriptional regulator [Microbacterium hominis]QYF97169.1 LacI family transcriptional regulator [Microbacterium sp. PAMC21962]
MSRRATIHDVAAAAGVSVATVSKAVNGRYGVASETVSRVLDAVAELGYESSLVASSMRSRRTGVVGVLVSDFEPFSAEVLKGVGAALSGHRYDLLAYSGARDADPQGWERRSLSRLSGTLIDAAIMVTPTVVGVNADVPIVAVDPHAGRVDIPSVESDSLTGGFEATMHLIELGHRRIGYLAGRPELRSSEMREAGYRRALRQSGIRFDPALVAVGMYDPDTVRVVGRALLQQPDRPTAVFAANDRTALGLIDVAAELGLDVPGDLSVIGFDDIPEAFLTARPLSTVRQPIQRLGAEAARMLVTMLAGATPEATHLVLPTRLIPRATTAPLR